MSMRELLCTTATALLISVATQGCYRRTGAQEPTDRQQTGFIKSDAGPRPSLKVRLGGVPYLATAVQPDAFITVTIVASRIPPQEARQKIYDSMVLESYPSKGAIQGTWSGTLVQSSVTFQPTKPLAPGDYLVRFPNASPDFVVHPRPYNLFRVGPGLRLTHVELLRDKATTKSAHLARVALRFSQAVPTSDVVSLGIRTKNQASQWAIMQVSQVNNYGWNVVSPIVPTEPLQITVSSSTLDGKWNGTPGSGAVTVDFLPKDYTIEPGQAIYPVPPELSYDPFSGVPKP